MNTEIICNTKSRSRNSRKRKEIRKNLQARMICKLRHRRPEANQLIKLPNIKMQNMNKQRSRKLSSN